METGNQYFGQTGSDFYVEERSRRRNPILAVLQACEKLSPKIDALICLGDIAHQSKRLPFMQAWNDLHQLSRELSIKEVLAVTGNHDVLSRADDISDAETRLEFLKTVHPDFPYRDSAFKSEYFGTGVAKLNLGSLCIIAIDTCRAHGLGSSEQASKKIWEVGHISQIMRERVLSIISESLATHFLILMHHHPDRVDDIIDIHDDAMDGGAEFIRDIALLDRNCIVLHGHKHQVKLKYAVHGSPPPVVFSAATFASKPYPQQSRGFENLFHIMDIDLKETEFPAGAIYSWNWSGAQWGHSKSVDIPHYLPFGPQIDIAKVATCLGSIPITSKVMATELFEKCPELKFVQNSQLDLLNEKLRPLRRELVSKQSKIHAMLEED